MNTCHPPGLQIKRASIILKIKGLPLCGNFGAYAQYMGFTPQNPNSPKLAGIYDQGIRALRASGELAAILARYGVEDWES